MREVFAVTDSHPSPGDLFYTIRREDVGKTVIKTEAGPISLGSVTGYVISRDIGKRLTRTLDNAGVSWVWHMESDEQHSKRLAREQAGHRT